MSWLCNFQFTKKDIYRLFKLHFILDFSFLLHLRGEKLWPPYSDGFFSQYSGVLFQYPSQSKWCNWLILNQFCLKLFFYFLMLFSAFQQVLLLYRWIKRLRFDLPRACISFSHFLLSISSLFPWLFLSFLRTLNH